MQRNGITAANRYAGGVPAIAYLGPEGTFTEAALRAIELRGLIPLGIPHAAAALTPLPTDSTAAALAAVRSGDADYACVPIENSIDGSVCRPWTASPAARRCRSSPS